MKKINPLILPLIIGILSSISLLYNVNDLNIPKLIISLIGILAVLLFFFNIRFYRTLFIIWIYAQFPYIITQTKGLLENGNTIFYQKEIFNASQSFVISLGLTFNQLAIKLNLIPFIYLWLFDQNVQTNLTEKSVEIKIGNKSNSLNTEQIVLNGEVIKAIRMDDKKVWIFAKLFETFQQNNETVNYKHILLYPYEGKEFKLNIEQMGYLKLVSNEIEIENLDPSINIYPSIDYVNVKFSDKV